MIFITKDQKQRKIKKGKTKVDVKIVKVNKKVVKSSKVKVNEKSAKNGKIETNIEQLVCTECGVKIPKEEAEEFNGMCEECAGENGDESYEEYPEQMWGD